VTWVAGRCGSRFGLAEGKLASTGLAEDVGEDFLPDESDADRGIEQGRIAVLVVGSRGAYRGMQFRGVPLAVRGEPPSVALAVPAHSTPIPDNSVRE
jgi:hypothetical protein